MGFSISFVCYWLSNLARIRTSPQLEQYYLDSFDKAWGGQFLLNNKDYLDVRWSYRSPKMGKLLECLVGM